MRDILNELLNDLKIAYEKSDIYKYCRKHSYEWFYSLLITSMEKGGPLVIGFNWGAAKNEIYQPQLSIKKINFSNEDIGSLSRIFPYCEKYFGHFFQPSLNLIIVYLDRTMKAKYH